MRISYIGKFYRLYDEEYIARSLEMLGHTVQRLPEKLLTHQFKGLIEEFKPDLVIMAKLFVTEPEKLIAWLKEQKIPNISWTFDLYWDYAREDRIHKTWGFKADKVFTTDGGHDEQWKSVGIDHQTVRQGIFRPECFLEPLDNPHGIVFVGSVNPLFPERQDMLAAIKKEFTDFMWYGEKDTHEMRGLELNKLYSKTKVVVGDSVYSPYYWSNRVVETLGRGGFLIHQEVPGLKEEYPNLVTYKKGDLEDLKTKIKYYLDPKNEQERVNIIAMNWSKVHSDYTMDQKCIELLSKL